MAKILWTGLLLTAFSPSGAVEPGPRPLLESGDREGTERFHHGLDLHQKAVSGDEEAVDEAMVLFEGLREDFPEDARVRAFLGNVYALKARDAVFFRKTGWLKRAFATIDSAVEQSPEDPHVRTVRAVNSYQIPGFLGRRDFAEEDFSVLLEWARTDPDRFTNGLLKFVYFHAGRFYAGEDERRGRRLLNKALELPDASVSEEEVQKELEAIRG